jgi:hypothetical protein
MCIPNSYPKKLGAYVSLPRAPSPSHAATAGWPRPAFWDFAHSTRSVLFRHEQFGGYPGTQSFQPIIPAPFGIANSFLATLHCNGGWSQYLSHGSRHVVEHMLFQAGSFLLSNFVTLMTDVTTYSTRPPTLI